MRCEEIRSICSGLVLPHIEAADLPEILTMAVRQHEQRTGSKVALSVSAAPKMLSTSAKICTYRFVQEALNNGFRHGLGVDQSVTQSFDGDRIHIEVADGGPGFDPMPCRPRASAWPGCATGSRASAAAWSCARRARARGSRCRSGREDIEPI